MNRYTRKAIIVTILAAFPLMAEGTEFGRLPPRASEMAKGSYRGFASEATPELRLEYKFQAAGVERNLAGRVVQALTEFPSPELIEWASETLSDPCPDSVERVLAEAIRAKQDPSLLAYDHGARERAREAENSYEAARVLRDSRKAFSRALMEYGDTETLSSILSDFLRDGKLFSIGVVFPEPLLALLDKAFSERLSEEELQQLRETERDAAADRNFLLQETLIMALFHQTGDMDILREGLSGENPSLFSGAVWCLGWLEDDAAVDLLLETAEKWEVRQSDRPTEWIQRRHVLIALARNRTDQTTDYLVGLLDRGFDDVGTAYNTPIYENIIAWALSKRFDSPKARRAVENYQRALAGQLVEVEGWIQAADRCQKR